MCLKLSLVFKLCIPDIVVGSQPAIGFHVAHSTTVNSGTKMVFNHVLKNYGNGWNSGTHMFTAPTKGLYSFTLSITSSGNRARAKIMLGNVVLRRVLAEKYGHNTGTGSTVVMLNAGQQVHAQRYSGTLYSDSNLWTHFVGFLITKVI